MHFWLIDELLRDVGKFEMTLAHDRKYTFVRNQSLRSLESGLKHRMAAKELHVLFRQRVASKLRDERAQPHAVARRQDDRAAIAHVGFVNRFVKHASRLQQYRGHALLGRKLSARSGDAVDILI